MPWELSAPAPKGITVRKYAALRFSLMHQNRMANHSQSMGKIILFPFVKCAYALYREESWDIDSYWKNIKNEKEKIYKSWRDRH